jgi:hypothetical protein
MSRYTEQELNARMRFTIGILLATCLVGIVFVVLYSLIFVTQPIGQQSPNDAEFFKLITPIATFLTGILSGIMLGKTDHKDGEKKNDTPELEPAKEPRELDNEDTIA